MQTMLNVCYKYRFYVYMYVNMLLSVCAGEHPRIGALDVCPFIPVANVTMKDCAELSRQFGLRLATELGVPVYLYEYAVAASDDRDYRRTLPQIRTGEYEGLEKKVDRSLPSLFLFSFSPPPSLFPFLLCVPAI